VRACFDGSAPSRLYHHTQAGRFTDGIKTASTRIRIRSESSSVKIPKLPSNSCLSWSVDLKQASGPDDMRLAMRVGGDLVMDTDLWFWRGPMQRDILVRVELPSGFSFSTPWTKLGRHDGLLEYRPDNTPGSWSSRTAVGQFEISAINVAGSELRLAVPGTPSDSQGLKLQQWIELTAKAVSQVYGQFPQASPQILVVPIGPRKEPVPWAHIIRGGGLGAEFFVDETRPLSEFTADWTGCHELSHMLLPFVSHRDRWLSEGLASYYQNVLLARTGNISDQQAWQDLYQGIRRGEAGTNGGTLTEAASAGRGQTMRVYWSGAALMLMADTRLRAEPGSSQSLDSALKALRDCCLKNGKSWRARNLLTELDRLTDSDIFSSLYQEHVDTDRFPDLTETWQALGVSNRFGRTRLIPDAPWAGIRQAIMKNQQ